MSSAAGAAPVRTLTARHVQLLRAAFAAIAALMITFSPDHSSTVGMSVFGGFTVAVGIMYAVAAWLVRDHRRIYIALGAISLIAGAASGAPVLHTTPGFFTTVMVWAAVSGIVELIWGIRLRGRDETARDSIVVGSLNLVLIVALLLVPMRYAWDYTIDDAGTFTLTGITLAVGIFGAYAAIVAVFLAIAGFSPRAEEPADAPDGAGSESASTTNTPSTSEASRD